MALINNIYVLVTDEEITRETKITQHAVEEGLPITSTVRSEPKTIAISGKIVDIENTKADAIISKIEELRAAGSLIDYKGRNVAGNFQIKSFTTSHPNTIWGGANFDMELVETRIAKNSYTPPKTTESAGELKVGDIVVFKGGPVYVSSDATKAAANRGRQTCQVTKISTKSWSIHQVHLISTEKKYPENVYGWVDGPNIEGVTGYAPVPTKPKSEGGLQDTKKGGYVPVYREMKFGYMIEPIKLAQQAQEQGLTTESGKKVDEKWITNKNKSYKYTHKDGKLYLRNNEGTGKIINLLMGYRTDKAISTKQSFQERRLAGM